MTESEFLAKSAVLCERIGKWPEQLVYDPAIRRWKPRYAWWTREQGGHMHPVPEPFVMGIMERFWRVWLERVRAEIHQIAFSGRYYWHSNYGAEHKGFDTYNAAQIAAVEAVLGEEEKDE